MKYLTNRMGGFRCSGAFFHCCHILLLFEVFLNLVFNGLFTQLVWALIRMSSSPSTCTYCSTTIQKPMPLLSSCTGKEVVDACCTSANLPKALDSETIASNNPHYIAENDLFTYSRFSSSSARRKSQPKINLPAWRSRQMLFVFVGERRGPGFVQEYEQSVKNRWSRTHRSILLQE